MKSQKGRSIDSKTSVLLQQKRIKQIREGFTYLCFFICSVLAALVYACSPKESSVEVYEPWRTRPKDFLNESTKAEKEDREVGTKLVAFKMPGGKSPSEKRVGLGGLAIEPTVIRHVWIHTQTSKPPTLKQEVWDEQGLAIYGARTSLVSTQAPFELVAIPLLRDGEIGKSAVSLGELSHEVTEVMGSGFGGDERGYMLGWVEPEGKGQKLVVLSLFADGRPRFDPVTIHGTSEQIRRIQLVETAGGATLFWSESTPSRGDILFGVGLDNKGAPQFIPTRIAEHVGTWSVSAHHPNELFFGQHDQTEKPSRVHSATEFAVSWTEISAGSIKNDKNNGFASSAGKERWILKFQRLRADLLHAFPELSLDVWEGSEDTRYGRHTLLTVWVQNTAYCIWTKFSSGVASVLGVPWQEGLTLRDAMLTKQVFLFSHEPQELVDILSSSKEGIEATEMTATRDQEPSRFSTVWLVTASFTSRPERTLNLVELTSGVSAQSQTMVKGLHKKNVEKKSHFDMKNMDSSATWVDIRVAESVEIEKDSKISLALKNGEPLVLAHMKLCEDSGACTQNATPVLLSWLKTGEIRKVEKKIFSAKTAVIKNSRYPHDAWSLGCMQNACTFLYRESQKDDKDNEWMNVFSAPLSKFSWDLKKEEAPSNKHIYVKGNQLLYMTDPLASFKVIHKTPEIAGKSESSILFALSSAQEPLLGKSHVQKKDKLSEGRHRALPLPKEAYVRRLELNADGVQISPPLTLSTRARSAAGIAFVPVSEPSGSESYNVAWAGRDASTYELHLANIGDDGHVRNRVTLTTHQANPSSLVMVLVPQGVLIAWTENRFEKSEVYATVVDRNFKRIAKIERVSDEGAEVSELSCVVFRGRVYIAWTDFNAKEGNGGENVYVARVYMHDAKREGQLFRLSSASNRSHAPSIFVIDGKLHLMWIADPPSSVFAKAPYGVQMASLNASLTNMSSLKRLNTPDSAELIKYELDDVRQDRGVLLLKDKGSRKLHAFSLRTLPSSREEETTWESEEIYELAGTAVSEPTLLFHKYVYLGDVESTSGQMSLRRIDLEMRY